MKIIAKDIQKNDILDGRYKVIWKSNIILNGNKIQFDVKEFDGLVKSVVCPIGYTFEVKRD